jgi:two-component system OmpR family sensor kinase
VPVNCLTRAELVTLNAQLMDENAKLLDAIKARDAFLVIAAHELRNPMTAIAGRVGFLRRLLSKRSTSQEKVLKSCEQLDWLISRYIQRATMLLDVSRVNTGNCTFNPSSFDICKLIHEVSEALRPLAGHAGSQICFELPSEGLMLHTDRLSLEQILDNLISNAINYGGATQISVQAWTDSNQGRSFISIHDKGPGIALIDQARIFEKFERAAPTQGLVAGFGVGLWIVRELTEALGGTITVQSELGAGSSFTISMPIKLEKETQ